MLAREVVDQLRHLLRPIATKVANTAARAIVRLVDDSTKMQLLQIELLAGEVRVGAEHVQPYGFSSVPLAGADTAAVIFPNGDRGHPLVVAVADRRYRPTGGDGGDVNLYHFTGARIRMTKDGDIVATPAPGRRMLVDDGSGAAALPTMTDFAGIVSILSSCGAGAATAVPATLSAYQAAHPGWPFGTTVLAGK